MLFIQLKIPAFLPYSKWYENFLGKFPEKMLNFRNANHSIESTRIRSERYILTTLLLLLIVLQYYCVANKHSFIHSFIHSFNVTKISGEKVQNI